MSTHTVTFLPEGTTVEVAEGETLLAAADRAGLSLRAACGGQGVCGKCLVRVLHEGEVEEVLGCQTPVTGDLRVEVPEETRLDEARVLTEGAGELTSEVPLAQHVTLDLGTNEARETCDARVLATLEPYRTHFRDLSLDLFALRRLPLLLQQESGPVRAVLADWWGTGRVIDVTAATHAGSYGAAIDLGTTTIVVGLVDLATGEVVRTQAHLNAQGRYGADVISRMVFAQEDRDGLAELRAAALENMNRCLREVADAQGIAAEEMVAATIAGNTTMVHLLLGIDPAGIRRDPYVPAVRTLPVLAARDVGLVIHPRAPVYIAPGVSSYVGGDIVAGLYAAGAARPAELTLFIDLGTNGEMVVAQGDWLVCCSCSAGPAFEGSGLDHGTYARPGAIESFTYDAATDRMHFRTIGDEPPCGVCGSGYIDALAELLRAGAIDRGGRINPEFPSPRVRADEERREFVLVWGREIDQEEDITLGGDDIQNLLRAKAAIYSGVTTLLDSLGLAPGQVQRLLLAGGFGNYLHVDNAVAIGLLPDLPRERLHFLGNTAFAGACRALLRRGAREDLEQLSRRLTNFELSTVPGYMERYVSSLFLPHTDLSLFPSVT